MFDKGNKSVKLTNITSIEDENDPIEALEEVVVASKMDVRLLREVVKIL